MLLSSQADMCINKCIFVIPHNRLNIIMPYTSKKILKQDRKSVTVIHFIIYNSQVKTINVQG